MPERNERRRRRVNGTARRTYIGEIDFSGEDKIAAVATKDRVRFVLDDEDDVGRDGRRALVAFAWKSDLRALLPTGLDVDAQNFVFDAYRTVIRAENFPRDLHLLRRARRDLLKRDHEVVLNGRILRAFSRRLTVWTTPSRHAIAREVEAMTTEST